MTTLPPTDIAIRVRQAGSLTLLQDRGRFGVRHLGVTQGGPADLYSWAWANHLAGNPWGSASLEITFGGLQLVAERDLEIAIAGADLGATLEGKPAPLWRRIRWPEGQSLVFNTPVSGLRAYLSVHGGFAAPPAMGSVACVAREQLGGFDGYGRKLADDDQLRIFTPTTPATLGITEAPAHARPDFQEPPQLDLLPGAQIAEFTGNSLFDAFNAWWRVDDRADRMGVRLKGPKLECRTRSLISEGINLGSLQVPPDGQPIALLNDRQTIGGYPRLGALSPLAASRLGQCLPGQEVRLIARSSEAVLREYRAFLAAFNT
ncbi:biotin-dependent carboxyltransferase family protein [Halomonas halocynthiae]|uniref:5-oxoprolinase subunit C family protein n=1 Tax=Halomonas halocynthiae TaxID=176290 RepID=UPI000400D3A0|nr:biotin-dependent carboxyltransferase family protein [Halomonas halocynthiae]